MDSVSTFGMALPAQEGPKKTIRYEKQWKIMYLKNRLSQQLIALEGRRTLAASKAASANGSKPFTAASENRLRRSATPPRRPRCRTRTLRHGLRTLVERFDIEPFPDFSAK